MEVVEGVINSLKKLFKKRSAPTTTIPDSKPETVVIPKIPGWNYEVFREYLLALTKSRDYILPIDEYPSQFELSQPWHEAFNQIRIFPQEGWVLVGFENGQRKLILPKVAEKGLSHSVSLEVMSAALSRAKTKAGVTDLIGDAHSHPRSFSHPSWHIPSKETSDGNGSFSLADMYSFLYYLSQQRPSDTKQSVMFVAEGNENIAAFGTKGSLEIVRNNPLDSYAKFAKYWYERSGWEFKGREPNSTGGGELANPIRNDAPKPWQINKAIAHRYQLALYRGFKDGPMLRDFPTRITV